MRHRARSAVSHLVPCGLAAGLALALTACAGDQGSPGGSADGTDGGDPDAVDVGHIHGVELGPDDGVLYVATHHGVFAVDGDGPAERVSEDRADYMSFTITDSGTFLGSGHPAPDEAGPANRGLLESTDAGRTWTTVSLSDEADFHALSHVHGSVYGYNSVSGTLLVSDDQETWDERATLPLTDLAVHPDDAEVVLATTEDGVARSTDGGRTFDDGSGDVLAYLSWTAPDSLYGVGVDGTVRHSDDGGASWTDRGTAPGGQPQALTAVDGDHLLVATESGVHESDDGGATFTQRLVSA